MVDSRPFNGSLKRKTYLGLRPGIDKLFHTNNILSAVLLMSSASVRRTEMEGNKVLVVDKRSILSFFVRHLNQGMARTKLDGVVCHPRDITVVISVQTTSRCHELGAHLATSTKGSGRGGEGKEETVRELHRRVALSCSLCELCCVFFERSVGFGSTIVAKFLLIYPDL